MAEENTNNESAESKTDNSNSWIDNIFNWVANPIRFSKEIEEEIIEDIQQWTIEQKEATRPDGSSTTLGLARLVFEDSLPAKALLGYIADSAKANIKASVLKFSGHGKYTPSPSQEEVDAQRDFDPSSMFTKEHIDALNTFVQKHMNDKGVDPLTKKILVGKEKDGKRSIDLSLNTFRKEVSANPLLGAMASTVGTVRFTLDPTGTKPDEYFDEYGWNKARKIAGFLPVGPSEGRQYKFSSGLVSQEAQHNNIK